MNTDQAILSEIAEELPYLRYVDTNSLPIIRFALDQREFGFPEIFIYGHMLHVHLYDTQMSIDLYTCKDPVKEVDEYLRKHLKLDKYGY